MDKGEPDMGVIAAFEQADTGLENMALLLARYYENLIEVGVPDTLAQRLVVDLQQRFIPKASGS